jgi:hypothetical protein
MLAALEQHRTTLADPPCSRFPLDPGLGSFGVRGEERVGLSAAGTESHPYRGLPSDRLREGGIGNGELGNGGLDDRHGRCAFLSLDWARCIYH